MIDPLTTFAIRNGTDKFGPHDYAPHYHKMFAALRERPLRVLELGVGGYTDEFRGGLSLATWRDYFPNSQVTGLDVHKKTLSLGDRVRIYQASQVDARALARIVEERGPFDIIVDDGSHQNAHVVESFRLLWPEVVPEGIYAIEDVQTAYWPRWGGSLELEAPNTVGLFRKYLARLPEDVAGIERFHNIIALHKIGPAGMSFDRSTAPALVEGGIVSVHSVSGRMPLSNAGSRPVTRGTLEEVPSGTNAVVLDARQDGSEDVEMAMSRLPESGLLILEGSAQGSLADLLSRLWVEIDHREILVRHRTVSIHPLAARLRAIERFPEGWVLVKGLNDYPSNLDFDTDHPQVQQAMAVIAEVLSKGGSEEAFARHAPRVVKSLGQVAAAPMLRQLGKMGSTSRLYLRLTATGQVQDGNHEAAEATFALALEKFPDDPEIGAQRALNLLHLSRFEQAREVAEMALRLNPRHFGLNIAMVRIAGRLDLIDLRLRCAETAVKHAKGRQKARARAELGLALHEAGRPKKAELLLRKAVEEGHSPPPVLRALRQIESRGTAR